MDIFILGIAFVLLLVFFLFYTIQFFNVFFRGFAPFYSTRKKIISAIIDKIEIKESDRVVELGCGKAGFLQAVRQKFPKAQLIGYEYSLLPYLIAQIQNSFKKNNLDIQRVNFFKTDLSKADIIYCYLSIRTMKDLENKFLKECKQGTRIVSYMFELPNTKPIEIQNIAKGEKVYHYIIE